MVSEEVRSKLLKKREPYETRETLVCRSWFKIKKQVFNVHYEYNITAVEGSTITLSNAVTLPVSLIKNKFVHNYCRTCHSFQGSTIQEAITIFDHKVRVRFANVALHRRHKGYGPQAGLLLRLRRERREGERDDTVLL